MAVSIEQLFEAGAHFGHKTNRWSPKQKTNIHSSKGGIHIINLEKTVQALEKYLPEVTKVVAKGGKVLFVGTKTQLKEVIKVNAEIAGMPYITERWLGGMLTNRQTINDRIKKLKTLESRMETGELINRYSKLEVQRFQEEIDKLNRIFGGIKDMNTLPQLVFIADTLTNDLAIKEAKTLGIPVIGLVDSNADPTKVEMPIPGNDDATSAVSLIASYIAEAINKGKDQVK
jgi:small subunit ribosomal protein S2